MPEQPFYSDRDLFLQISEGDRDAFKILFDRYVAKLYPYILEVLKSPSGAEDIIQESFIRIWMSREKLETIENPSSWIFKIALNQCYNVLRRKLTESKALGIVKQEHFSQGPYDQQDIQFAQTKRFIAEAIDQLTPQRRKIYDMSRVNGMKVGQIANELNLSVSTVKNTLAAALSSIREHLAGCGIVYSFLTVLFFDNFPG